MSKHVTKCAFFSKYVFVIRRMLFFHAFFEKKDTSMRAEYVNNPKVLTVVYCKVYGTIL